MAIEKVKQDFQLGDIVYWVDDDYRWFESYIRQVGLCGDGIIEYSTNDIDFNTEDIGKWVFKTEQDREDSQYIYMV